MSKLYLVHAIDTEGPLYESIEATFERLEKITGLQLEASAVNLEKIKNKELDLNGHEDLAALITSEQLLNYNDTWDKVDQMLYELLSPEFRQRYADSLANGWIYSWFVVDHVGFKTNPRRRDIGYHNVYDHYKFILKETNSLQDEINWHFHPASRYQEAHICATNYINSPHLYEGLARGIIDRQFFPSTFRPGFHAERPDAHWFLEQWIPFDYGNQAIAGEANDPKQNDVSAGRLGDWRRAINDWSPYKPSHDDYQIAGNCNRTIFRCLNVGTRFKLLDEQEVRRAFARAHAGKDTILAFTNHDFRDMRNDVEYVHKLVSKVAKDYPEVIWQHSGAKEAAQQVLELKKKDFRLSAKITKLANGLHLDVKANYPSFGPQPFLAVKTKDKRYLSDNFDLQTPKRHWTYVFDQDSIMPDSIDSIGIASNDQNGNTFVINLKADGTIISQTSL